MEESKAEENAVLKKLPAQQGRGHHKKEKNPAINAAVSADGTRW